MRIRIEPELKAHFREVARNIIASDRNARKHGLSQNTIGDITHALSKVYVMGREGLGYSDLAVAQTSANVVDWSTIPPRSRNTLEEMSCAMSKRLGLENIGIPDMERITLGRKLRWQFVQDGKATGSRTFSDGGVTPLIRMKLLEAIDESENTFRLSALGHATCEVYWRRSDSNDPTLPKINLR